jgi:elongation of very long chain fatty acids protein 6
MDAFTQYQRDFDGHDAQRYFARHPLLPAVVVALYLLAVWRGPLLMQTRQPFKLRVFSRCWNIAIAVFSIFGALVCVPHLVNVLRRRGFWFSVCADVYELAGYGAPALWAAAFTWSKLLELVDTMLLILKKRQVITLHWFHHASVIGFAWAAWTYETPAALWYGAMNFSVHSVMYTYFFLMGVSSWRATASRAAPVITALQISQFVWGTVINIYAAVAFYSSSCSIQSPILYLGAVLYLVYGALFVDLFVKRYVRKRPVPGGRSGSDDAPLRPQNKLISNGARTAMDDDLDAAMMKRV